MTAYSAYVIADEATKYYQSQKESESLDNRIDNMSAEHTKGARPSTKGKHQKCQANKKKARGGEKGERLPPRKRHLAQASRLCFKRNRFGFKG